MDYLVGLILITLALLILIEELKNKPPQIIGRNEAMKRILEKE